MRGKALCRAAPWYQPGITPACAGKSLFCAPLPLTGRDHPRACGEKCLPSSSRARSLGSPPRVRGKANLLYPPRTAAGITPARAGKSCCGQLSRCNKRDHPRACGEKGKMEKQWLHDSGSPPRVRGKVRQTYGIDLETGITPARAGKSNIPGVRSASMWDHPRACGEKYISHI